MSDLEFNQTLLFITGKGGVGKSLLSSIVSIDQARQGKKILIIDAESSGDVARYFEHSEIGYESVEVMNNISVLQCNTDDALAEYLRLHARIPTWARITPLARLIDLVSHAAPGVREILIAGKIAYEAKRIADGESQFDMVIVDAPSSGHIISLLDAPHALGELITRGVIQTQTDWMKQILTSSKTGVLVVMTPNDIVVTETHELLNNIEQHTHTNITGIILNKDFSQFPYRHNQSHESESEVLRRVREYYEEQIQQSNDVLSQFPQYRLFSFPLLGELNINIRTLTKNVERLLEVKKDNPTLKDGKR